MEPLSPPREAITIELLDSATGQPQQSWRFAGVSRVQIGRSRENDVVVSNPYVSRSHAYLERAGDRWTAIAISAQQLLSSGRTVQSVDLIPGTIFRLGPNGCTLKFAVESLDKPSEEGFDFTGTLSFEGPQQPELTLDQDQLSREVTAIVEGDFFQALASEVDRLRHPPAERGRC
ncbi:MAG TPA: FHA domain-containing protein [Caulifigura sp.]|nr:FHA domain-containing protein [Caulifigura sp.]